MRHTLPLPLLPLLVCVVLALVAGPHSPYLAEAAEPLIEGRCRPQGILKDPPYQHPRRVTLPFCQQYGCSCCAAGHAQALQRASRVIAEDEDLSTDCKLGLLRLTCRVCDPLVGTGAKRHTCRDTCSSLFEACAQDFFSYDSSTGLVSPCSEQTSGMLVCSHLTDLVSSPAEFCKAAGFGRMQPADAGPDEPCFDGSPVSADACPATKPDPDTDATSAGGSSQRRQQQRRKASSQAASDPLSYLLSLLPWKLKRRHKKQLAVAAELLMGTAIASLMAWLTLVVLRRVMQPSVRAPTGPPPTNVREVLARAAEVRSSRVAAGAASGGTGGGAQKRD